MHPYGRLVSMEEVIAGLNAALGHLDRARDHLVEARQKWAGAAQLYLGTLQDSQQQEPRDVRAIVTTLDTTRFPQLCTTLLDLQAKVRQRIRHYGGKPRASAPAAVARPSPSGPAAVTNQHGDRYPPGAAGLVEHLPPRVVARSGDRTVGVPRVAGKAASPISSGYDPDLSEAITVRLSELGIRSTYLRFHTEMKVAQMMIRTGHRVVELAINNVACGIEGQKNWPDSCDKVLDQFLPPGFRLTVFGTTRDNRPWRKTYGTGGEQHDHDGPARSGR
jgi:hypothetical protein